MENKYLNDYIMSYNKINNFLNVIYIKNKDKIKREIMGYTTFYYPIEVFKIGSGKKHVLLIGTTHGCELVTTHFILEMILSLVNEKQDGLLKEYTFHLIPILNVEGYIISSCNVLSNLRENYTIKELEELATKYLNVYNEDDEIALTGKKVPKKFYSVLNSSIYNLSNFNLITSVKKILKSCKLTDCVLPIWAANGVGVDPNSNSIHCFKEIKKLRACQKFANLRYNDIPVTRPSPMSYPGERTFANCPENFALYKYINKLYDMNTKGEKEDKLIAIFSYHSTGGEIYSYPAKECMDEKKYELYKTGMEEYKKYTGYTIVDEKLKYGVMDYYRANLEDVLCLTIELSKLNANSIGPFANICDLNSELLDNKSGVIHTINKIM